MNKKLVRERGGRKEEGKRRKERGRGERWEKGKGEGKKEGREGGREEDSRGRGRKEGREHKVYAYTVVVLKASTHSIRAINRI